MPATTLPSLSTVTSISGRTSRLLTAVGEASAGGKSFAAIGDAKQAVLAQQASEARALEIKRKGELYRLCLDGLLSLAHAANSAQGTFRVRRAHHLPQRRAHSASREAAGRGRLRKPFADGLGDQTRQFGLGLAEGSPC